MPQLARRRLIPLLVFVTLGATEPMAAEDRQALDVQPLLPQVVREPYFPLPLPPVVPLPACGYTALSATNPPTLEEYLAAAEQRLDDKTNAAAPLIEAVHKAEVILAPAQSAHASALQEAAKLQQSVDALSAEVKQITDTRAQNDAERATVATRLNQTHAARPLVAEALRHLTEAVGKAPNDATLTEAHKQLTEKLTSFETTVAELQAQNDELTAAIAAADAALKDTGARLNAARQASAAAADRVAALQLEAEKLAAALDATRKAAAPVESAVALAQREVERWQHEIAFRDRIVALAAELAAARTLAAERQSELDLANEQLATAKSQANAATARYAEASRTVDTIAAQIQAARTAR